MEPQIAALYESMVQKMLDVNPNFTLEQLIQFVQHTNPKFVESESFKKQIPKIYIDEVTKRAQDGKISKLLEMYISLVGDILDKQENLSLDQTIMLLGQIKEGFVESETSKMMIPIAYDTEIRRRKNEYIASELSKTYAVIINNVLDKKPDLTLEQMIDVLRSSFPDFVDTEISKRLIPIIYKSEVHKRQTEKKLENSEIYNRHLSVVKLAFENNPNATIEDALLVLEKTEPGLSKLNQSKQMIMLIHGRMASKA